MKEIRFFYVPEAAQQEELPQDEAFHALRVLRLKGGDELFLMDGVGSFYRAQVTMVASDGWRRKFLSGSGDDGRIPSLLL